MCLRAGQYHFCNGWVEMRFKGLPPHLSQLIATGDTLKISAQSIVPVVHLEMYLQQDLIVCSVQWFDRLTENLA